MTYLRFSKKSEAEDAMSNLNGHFFHGATRGLEVKVAEDHGRQKAAFYAGWMVGQVRFFRWISFVCFMIGCSFCHGTGS